jgi:hypothetical protein
MENNKTRGNDFAKCVQQYLSLCGHVVQAEYSVEVGLNIRKKKLHKFDFGNDELIVECKSYDWTRGNNAPSAKMSILNEAMLYFLSAPQHYKKMLFIAKTRQKTTQNPETLAEYYVRLHGHFIPNNTEIWEFDKDTFKAKKIEI